MREMNIRGVLIKKKWGAKYRGGGENWALTVSDCGAVSHFDYVMYSNGPIHFIANW